MNKVRNSWEFHIIYDIEWTPVRSKNGLSLANSKYRFFLTLMDIPNTEEGEADGPFLSFDQVVQEDKRRTRRYRISVDDDGELTENEEEHGLVEWRYGSPIHSVEIVRVFVYYDLSAPPATPKKASRRKKSKKKRPFPSRSSKRLCPICGILILKRCMARHEGANIIAAILNIKKTSTVCSDGNESFKSNSTSLSAGQRNIFTRYCYEKQNQQTNLQSSFKRLNKSFTIHF